MLQFMVGFEGGTKVLNVPVPDFEGGTKVLNAPVPGFEGGTKVLNAPVPGRYMRAGLRF